MQKFNAQQWFMLAVSDISDPMTFEKIFESTDTLKEAFAEMASDTFMPNEIAIMMPTINWDRLMAWGNDGTIDDVSLFSNYY